MATWQVLGGSAPDRLDRLASEEKKGFETLIGLTYAPEVGSIHLHTPEWTGLTLTTGHCRASFFAVDTNRSLRL